MPPRKSRPSRPPIKRIPTYETLTSHDGTPCTIAWGRTILAPNRPPASIQIYDTTPSSASNGEENAKSLSKGPLDEAGEVHFRERLDIYGLAIDASVSEDERIAKCIAHQRAEIADREAKGRKDLHMMFWHWGTYNYKRFILVINKETADWQDGEMLFVWFDPVEMPEDADYDLPEIRVERYKGLDKLMSEMNSVRRHFFMQCALDRKEFDDEYSQQNLWYFGPCED